MTEQQASLNFVSDFEDVARILFSPLFICDGILSQKAFTLEEDKGETYISVLRPAIPSFTVDMNGIVKEGNSLFGYALLNVGDIRASVFDSQTPLRLDVLPRNSGKRKSHAGIFATIGQTRLKGGSPSQQQDFFCVCVWFSLHRKGL